MTYQLKQSEIAATRTELLAGQGGKCALCRLPVKRACLDHDHGTGAVRGVLCSGCNACLGKLENSYKRYGVQNLFAFCNGLAAYLQQHAFNITGFVHPLHKTDEEKRLARNAKARATRAAKKDL